MKNLKEFTKESNGVQSTSSLVFESQLSNDYICSSSIWVDKVICITKKLVHWGCMQVIFKFVNNGVQIKPFNANMTKLPKKIPNMYKGDLYSSHCFKYTPIVASPYGKCGNIICVLLNLLGHK